MNYFRLLVLLAIVNKTTNDCAKIPETERNILIKFGESYKL